MNKLEQDDGVYGPPPNAELAPWLRDETTAAIRAAWTGGPTLAINTLLGARVELDALDAQVKCVRVAIGRDPPRWNIYFAHTVTWHCCGTLEDAKNAAEHAGMASLIRDPSRVLRVLPELRAWIAAQPWMAGRTLP